MASSSYQHALICFIIFFSSCLVRRNSAEPPRRVFLNPDDPESTIASKVYRTAYHFQPPKNWINDPNGPMYYNGIYHLFYQYNPKGAVWGNIAWAHSVSTDLINWTPLDPAIYPSKPFDINGCWSGSATILPGNKPVILYTGFSDEKKQVQNIAYPENLSDPFLQQWIKPDFNPVMAPVNDIDSQSFRDPTTLWLGTDDYWRVAVGAEIARIGMALLYRTKDFVHWEKESHPLHSSNSSGMWECPDFYPVPLQLRQGLDTSVNTDDVKHVLKMSVMPPAGYDSYKLGRYREEIDVFVPDDEADDHRIWLRYDRGLFYASKTFYDAEKKRRILWGWSYEADSQADDIAKGWAGIQTIPREVWLDTSGSQLMQWPVKEVESLRRDGVHFNDVELKPGDLFEIEGIKASQADAEVDFILPSLEKVELFNSTWRLDPPMACRETGASAMGGIGPFGLLVLASHSLDEYTAIYFNVYKADGKFCILLCSDQRRLSELMGKSEFSHPNCILTIRDRRSSFRTEANKTTYGGFVDVDVKNGGEISLRTMIDHSVVESFGGGGRTCITARAYPTVLLTGKPHLYAFNNGTETIKISKLKAWSMAKPRINLQKE